MNKNGEHKNKKKKQQTNTQKNILRHFLHLRMESNRTIRWWQHKHVYGYKSGKMFWESMKFAFVILNNLLQSKIILIKFHSNSFFSFKFWSQMLLIFELNKTHNSITIFELISYLNVSPMLLVCVNNKKHNKNRFVILVRKWECG